MTEKRFQIIYLGNAYDFVVKDHKTNRTYGTFQGDKKSMLEMLTNFYEENEQLKHYNQQIREVFEDGGVILTKNQFKSIIEMKNDESSEIRHLRTANAKLKDELIALKEYIQKK